MLVKTNIVILTSPFESKFNLIVWVYIYKTWMFILEYLIRDTIIYLFRKEDVGVHSAKNNNLNNSLLILVKHEVENNICFSIFLLIRFFYRLLVNCSLLYIYFSLRFKHLIVHINFLFSILEQFYYQFS